MPLDDLLKRRTFLKMLGSALIAPAIPFPPPTTKAPSSQPNILIILADDLGFNDLSCQGSKDILTPNIDRLAESGVVFTDAHPSASVCSPSRAGLLTGRYQQRFGHEANSPSEGFGMDVDETTLGEALKSLGYRTGVVGKWHVGNDEEHYPTRRGFDYFYGLRAGSRSYFYDSQKNDNPYNPQAIENNGEQVKFDGYLTDVLGEKAVEFIEGSKQPFFLFLSFTAPHTPMEATKEDLARFSKIKDKRRRTYASMVWAMDRAVGHVLDCLDRNNLSENTMIWFLSDNGGPTQSNSSDNSPLSGFKGIKFEGGIRVPFILNWKRLKRAGSSFDGLTSALDIFPTCVAAAGDLPSRGKPLDGINLLPFLTGGKSGAPHQKLYWHKLWFSAMREDKWKLIYVDTYGYALYNLEKDLSEAHNLADKMPKRVESMKADLNAWKASLSDPLWSEDEYWHEVRGKDHIDLIKGVDKSIKKKKI